MVRRLDREIEAWGHKSARAQLSLLWDDFHRHGVRTIGYWEGDEWGSPFVIYSSEPKRGRPGKWMAHCFVNFGRPDLDELLISEDREVEIQQAPVADARDIRRLLEIPGVEEREELAGLMITLGHRRDEMDLPAFNRFVRHRDKVVRYAALGVLSWQPSVSNGELAGKFGEDEDPKVRDLAARLSTGRTRRRTRP